MKNDDVPDVYELRPLLFPALPLDPSINPTSPAALARSLRCAEPFENHLYLGSTDGNIFCFIQPDVNENEEKVASTSSSLLDVGGDGGGSIQTGKYLHQDFRHIGTRSISSKPIERILIIASLRIAAVLSESTITFHELPSFLPIPQQVLPHTKGVATFALDDEQINGADKDAEGLIDLCIVRRKNIMLVKMSKDTWRVVKEIPLPGGATNARRFGDWLCISTTSEYNIVNLKEATLSPVGLPISQTSESPSASCRPSILSISSEKEPGKCEFLITSHSEELTLGVFIGQEGEPTARLIEWPSHPRALMLEYPYVHALLRNDTIEVHNLVTMQKEQIVHLPPLLEPRTLSNSSSFIEFRQAAADMGMSSVSIRLEKGGQRIRTERKKGIPSDSLQQLQSKSRVLMIGKNVVQGMFKSRILDSAIRALRRGDHERAEILAEQAWNQKDVIDKKSFEYTEFKFVNQVLAVKLLQRLRFEDAGKFFIRGEMDPRLVLSLFPSVFDQIDFLKEAEIDLFTNVVDILDEIGNLEDWPRRNLIMNYCPPLDAETNTSLNTLREAMTQRIQTLYHTLLTYFRTQDSLKSDVELQKLLDTSYALTLIRDGQGETLSSFLSTSNHCSRDIIEPQLASVGCYASLIQAFEDREDWSSALELHVKLLDGELIDPTYAGTTQNVAVILNRCEDSQLVQQYGIWLIQHDANAGVKILTKGQSMNTSGKSEDELLDELSRLDEKAAMAFLEAIALTRKNQDKKVHRRLFRTLIEKIQKALMDESERQAMKQITDEFVEGKYAESFVGHLALHAETSTTVTNRLKLMALIQTSTMLDIDEIQKELDQIPLLAYERAIVLGRQKKDEAALELLAITLRDANSAETYCSQDRKPLSLITLQSIDLAEIKVYCTFVGKTLKRKPITFTKSDQLSLIKVLLHVYMEKSVGNEFEMATTHLLNTQAMFLSPKEILALVPSHWTVQMLENFLSRSIRREIHRSNEGHIQRAIGLAQNLEVAETLWSKRRGLGGVIEDGSEDMADDMEGGDGMDDVGRALVEKVEGQEKLGNSYQDNSSPVEDISNSKE